MYIIVGLGNPGSRYEGTGFRRPEENSTPSTGPA